MPVTVPITYADPPPPPCYMQFATELHDWLVADGIPVTLGNFHVAQGDSISVPTDDEPHGAVTLQSGGQWHTWLVPQFVKAGCAIIKNLHSTAPITFWDTENFQGVQVLFHEWGHQFNMKSEGIVEAVAQDLTRRWFTKVAKVDPPSYSDMSGYHDRDVAIARKVSAQMSGLPWPRSQMARRIMLLSGAS